MLVVITDTGFVSPGCRVLASQHKNPDYLRLLLVITNAYCTTRNTPQLLSIRTPS